MTANPERGQFWRYLGALIAPTILLGLFLYLLWVTRSETHEAYDRAALREWIEESSVFRLPLPVLVRDYLRAVRGDKDSPEQLILKRGAIQVQLESLGNPIITLQQQLPLFTAIYRLELDFPESDPPVAPIIWESKLPRPRNSGQVRQLEYPIRADDQRAILHVEYQMHAYNEQQRDEQQANQRLRLVSGMVVLATALTFLWIYLFQRRERERERLRVSAQEQINRSKQLLLEEELRRQEIERRHEEAERDLLEQRLATQAAERQALELKSQLYASIGIMAGSYAHNIKNLLVRPHDLLRRCLETNQLSPDQDYMLREVRKTLGTVTERLQQILSTVRRDPSRSELTRLDLNILIRDLGRNWEDLAREKWKLTLTTQLSAEPLWVAGDLSHLQQAVENLLFNARDATFEMRSHLREQARKKVSSGQWAVGSEEMTNGGPLPPSAEESRSHEAASGGPSKIHPDSSALATDQWPLATDEKLRQALIAAASWRGTVILRTRRDGNTAILEVQDNGIGMSDEVRRRCTETHFSTKRDNALYEGNSTGMGLGLSFVVVILGHHQATLDIESEPFKGALFRIRFPIIA
jgi:signal transduction histidine kinase